MNGPPAFERLKDLAKEWNAEAAVLAKYGDEKTANLLRQHATIVAAYAELTRRQTALPSIATAR